MTTETVHVRITPALSRGATRAELGRAYGRWSPRRLQWIVRCQWRAHLGLNESDRMGETKGLCRRLAVCIVRSYCILPATFSPQ